MNKNKNAILTLIGAICLLPVVVINLLNNFMEIPTALDICTIPLGVACVVLNVIAIVRMLKNK